jgi:hypothetical protein
MVHFASFSRETMSFDLFFCSPTGDRVDFESVAAWAAERGPFVRNPEQLWYSNDDTGVYFSIDFAPNPPNPPEDSPLPAGLSDSGLSFNLNFNRPSFFGHEAMPFVEGLANRFGLWVFNPQSTESELLREVEAERLIHSWLDSNRRAILALAEQSPEFTDLFHMSLERSLYQWNFDRARARLQQTCGEEVFVPRLVPVHRNGHKSVGRAFTCTQSVPTVLPDSEWVFIVREKSSFWRREKKSEVGVVSRETFDELLRQYIEPFDLPDVAVQVIRPRSTEKVAKLLASLEQMWDRSHLTVLAKDSFVDIELPGKT